MVVAVAVVAMGATAAAPGAAAIIMAVAVAITAVTEVAHKAVMPISITAFITGQAVEAIITGRVEAMAALMSTTAFLTGPAMAAITTVQAVAATTIDRAEEATVTAIIITAGGIGRPMAPAWRPAWQLAPTSTLCHRTVCTRSLAAWRIAIATMSGISRNTRIPVSTMSS